MDNTRELISSTWYVLIIIKNLLFNLIQWFLLQDVLQKPADEFGNDNMLEELWAKRAFEHAEIHFNVTQNPRKFCLIMLF